MTALTPTIAPAVADYMRREIAIYGGRYELTFACDYHEATRTITSADWLGVGTDREAAVIVSDYKPGRVLVHNHTRGEIGVSGADLECIKILAPIGVGFGIIDNAVTTFVLARPPRFTWQFLEPPSPAARMRLWKLGGGFTLVHQQKA